MGLRRLRNAKSNLFLDFEALECGTRNVGTLPEQTRSFHTVCADHSEISAKGTKEGPFRSQTPPLSSSAHNPTSSPVLTKSKRRTLYQSRPLPTSLTLNTKVHQLSSMKITSAFITVAVV